MSNLSTIYVCSNCDAQFPKWSGRCLSCGKWGTLREETVDKKSKHDASQGISAAAVIDFDELPAGALKRLPTNISEVDRVLGGGVVPGSLILLTGEPGIGKSTIVAQIAGAVKSDSPVLYISGEESAWQVKERLLRLEVGTEAVRFVSETNVEKIIATLEKHKPALAIIDSIQTVSSVCVEAEPGGISQIRASTVAFLEMAKKNNSAIMLIGHITKDGSVAGPKSLEHIVDTVIYLEAEEKHDYRIMRATKNRFGSVNELGIFEMTGRGFKEIKNPGGVFLESGRIAQPGSVISVIMEGTRPFLLEVQALVTKTVFGYPQRKAAGFDLNRLQFLTAVLSKRAGVNLTNQDVIINVVGGLKVSDPALDLAVSLAITSSLLNQVVEQHMIVLGEVGLGGEVRSVSKLAERLAEAEKLGFNRAVVPDTAVKFKMDAVKVKKLDEIVKLLAK